tara:strand:- start:3689 stop:3871 length:183 start_codon:yes stop_codon:yes gene_type:complete
LKIIVINVDKKGNSMHTLEKIKEIVIELSHRLADELDYEDNLQSKLQTLLDYLESKENGQ